MVITAYLGMLNAIQTSDLINSLQYNVLDAISFSGDPLSEAIHSIFHGVHCQRPRYRPHSRPASYNAASFGRQLDQIGGNEPFKLSLISKFSNNTYELIAARYIVGRHPPDPCPLNPLLVEPVFLQRDQRLNADATTVWVPSSFPGAYGTVADAGEALFKAIVALENLLFSEDDAGSVETSLTCSAAEGRSSDSGEVMSTP
ncbi:hypothetical protein AAL_07670 [Moelleriella libera RCEF 2490]|uniref:Uncharacterized protein n=1 Tax=Moelleriella libera RCEF 2490 TaxID=1081109 RepID=A0A167WX05_9HYPO|nr:hypothetical protein AAL_07670 [Moelleriella libera RCEF 2490]